LVFHEKPLAHTAGNAFSRAAALGQGKTQKLASTSGRKAEKTKNWQPNVAGPHNTGSQSVSAGQ